MLRYQYTVGTVIVYVRMHRLRILRSPGSHNTKGRHTVRRPRNRRPIRNSVPRSNNNRNNSKVYLRTFFTIFLIIDRKRVYKTSIDINDSKENFSIGYILINAGYVYPFSAAKDKRRSVDQRNENLTWYSIEKLIY